MIGWKWCHMFDSIQAFGMYNQTKMASPPHSDLLEHTVPNETQLHPRAPRLGFWILGRRVWIQLTDFYFCCYFCWSGFRFEIGGIIAWERSARLAEREGGVNVWLSLFGFAIPAAVREPQLSVDFCLQEIQVFTSCRNRRGNSHEPKKDFIVASCPTQRERDEDVIFKGLKTRSIVWNSCQTLLIQKSLKRSS